MADIELVIKMSDDIYEQAINGTEYDTLSLGIKLRQSVQEGVVIPKGHGKIMDVDKIIKKLEEREERLKDDESIWETASVETAIDMFGETIIEADDEDIKSRETKGEKSAIKEKARLSHAESCYLEQGITQVF